MLGFTLQDEGNQVKPGAAFIEARGQYLVPAR